MFTMVASRTTISWAMPMKASAFHRCGSGAGVVVPAGAGDMGELRFEMRGDQGAPLGVDRRTTSRNPRADSRGRTRCCTYWQGTPPRNGDGSVGLQRLDV